MSWTEVAAAIASRTLGVMKNQYAQLEADTTAEIVYPRGEELPLVAIGPTRRLFVARRMRKDTVLNDELASRRVR